MSPIGAAMSPPATRIIDTITALRTLGSHCLSKLTGYMYFRPATLTFEATNALRRNLEFIRIYEPVSKGRSLRFSALL